MVLCEYGSAVGFVVWFQYHSITTEFNQTGDAPRGVGGSIDSHNSPLLSSS